MVSLAFDHWIGGGSERTYHTTNVLLHALNALLVFLLTRGMLRNGAMAAVVALLFAVHPIHVESVVWISERKNVLYLLFFLGASWRYQVFLQNGSLWTMAQVATLFLASLLSKAQAVTLPVFLFGLMVSREGWERWRERSLQLTPLFVVSLVFGLVAIDAQWSGGYLHTDREPSVLHRVAIAATAFVQYPIRILYPADLSVIHPLPASLSFGHFLALAVVSSMLGLFTLGIHKRWKVFPAFFLMYAASVLPIIQLVPIGSMLTADRYGYLASVPVLAGALGVLHGALWRLKPGPWFAYASLLATVLLFSTMTKRRAELWCDPTALFLEAVERYPRSEIARFNLAGEYMQAGRLAEARHHLHQALEIDPSTVEALIGLGQVDLADELPADAIATLTKAIVLAPDYPAVHTTYLARAMGYKALNEPTKAAADLRMLVEHRPGHARGWYELGLCHAMLGDHRQALLHYAKARTLGADEPSLALNVAISRGWQGDYESAIGELDRYLARFPDSSEGHYLLGIAKQRSGGDGCPDLQKALRLGHMRASEAIAAMCM